MGVLESCVSQCGREREERRGEERGEERRGEERRGEERRGEERGKESMEWSMEDKQCQTDTFDIRVRNDGANKVEQPSE
ncbi:hypothetical protein llap_1353 [Limosa lapponica baueri]|uniref:Uncharacterized protein n=1 Tax=Limosa lapponica baueri TaxID=1758121 RepID=A0A2I0UQM7_LIMLA|nr:hypothetical protein llap_1353 [Limosa lapponica baueri]